ncbi:hypothetical protein [Phocoenobacter skyensis]|uniref:hypothetical protein n=1 Tax=Phocoenobacter skyensis TaxID=97481 RepID=UPI002769015E|nr:hypothetical protein [Pasteurella skyensis]MDP8185302.1 hypothetical protein [Pasteurella skyensis]
MSRLLTHKKDYTSIGRKFNCKLFPSQQTTDNTDKQKNLLKEKCKKSDYEANQ